MNIRMNMITEMIPIRCRLKRENTNARIMQIA